MSRTIVELMIDKALGVDPVRGQGRHLLESVAGASLGVSVSVHPNQRMKAAGSTERTSTSIGIDVATKPVGYGKSDGTRVTDDELDQVQALVDRICKHHLTQLDAELTAAMHKAGMRLL